MKDNFPIMGNKYILWMVDAFSRMLAGVVLKDKKAETILEKLEMDGAIGLDIPKLDFMQIMEVSLEIIKWKSL